MRIFVMETNQTCSVPNLMDLTIHGLQIQHRFDTPLLLLLMGSRETLTHLEKLDGDAIQDIASSKVRYR